jgi:hypothetical protein
MHGENPKLIKIGSRSRLEKHMKITTEIFILQNAKVDMGSFGQIKKLVILYCRTLSQHAENYLASEAEI